MIDQSMQFRNEYRPIVEAVQAAGFFVTSMPMDCEGDRIVCCGLRRDEGGYTGNSFWFSERNGAWFMGTWSASIYRILDANAAAGIAVEWLQLNRHTTSWDVSDEIKARYELRIADDDEIDTA